MTAPKQIGNHPTQYTIKGQAKRELADLSNEDLRALVRLEK